MFLMLNRRSVKITTERQLGRGEQKKGYVKFIVSLNRMAILINNFNINFDPENFGSVISGQMAR